MSTLEQDQQLFADTLLQIQVHSALAKENVLNKKSPLPLLAKSCSLLDNLALTRPMPSTQKQGSPHAAAPLWTESQQNLIRALKIDAWQALADACLDASDLIQAEASLQRLGALQDAEAGPLSLKPKPKRPYNPKDTSNILSSGPSAIPATSLQPTDSHRKAALSLMETWAKLSSVYTDMGKHDLASNYTKRIQKMKQHSILDRLSR